MTNRPSDQPTDQQTDMRDHGHRQVTLQILTIFWINTFLLYSNQEQLAHPPPCLAQVPSQRLHVHHSFGWGAECLKIIVRLFCHFWVDKQKEHRSQ